MLLHYLMRCNLILFFPEKDVYSEDTRTPVVKHGTRITNQKKKRKKKSHRRLRECCAVIGHSSDESFGAGPITDCRSD